MLKPKRLLLLVAGVIGIVSLWWSVAWATSGVAFQGVVTDPSGNPIEGAYVNVFPIGVDNPTPIPGTQTDANGQFQILDTNITQGVTYRFEVFPPQGQNYTSPSPKEGTYSGTTVDLGTFQFITPTKTISGTITYSSSGGTVANAIVNAFKPDGFGFAQTTTNSSGEYTLHLSGGRWEVMPQATSTSDWAYGQPPTSVRFADDTSSESQTVDFTVEQATATVTGRLLKPDGSPVVQTDGLGVGVFNMEGKGGGGPIDNNNGTFSINVPAGSYIFNVWAPPDSLYSAPNINPFSVADGETKNLGDITLATKDATIQGTVTDGSGNPIANLFIEAFSRSGGGFSQGQTNSSGQYQIKVTSGTWMVMPRLSPSDPYALNSTPQEIKIQTNQTVTHDIQLTSASATIQGTVEDENGNPLSIYGFAFAQVNGSNFGPGGLGGPIERGSFSFKVPAGNYSVNLGLPPGSAYTPGSGVSLSIASGKTKNVTLTVKTNNATIQGTIKDQDGNPLSLSDLHVFAVSSNHTFQEGQVNGSTYTIQVATGSWSLGYFIDPSTGYISSPPDPALKFTISNSDPNITKNITLTKANSTISGTVKKPDGSAADGVFVSLENPNENGHFVAGSPTDSSGYYSLNVANGTYVLRVNVAPDSGFLSPAQQQVTVSNSNLTKNLTLRTSDATLSGTVKLGGNGVGAFVYAWSDDGGSSQTQANSLGQFSLAVSKGTTWHVGAFYQSNTTPYKATEVSVDPTATSTVNLTLSASSFTLPSPVSFTFDATNPKLITLDDGTIVNIPANALATSGNVTLTINPKATLPAQKQGKPVWYGYEFKAFNANGQIISQFNSSITITMPYDSDILSQLGLTPSDLVPSYWDSTTGTWKKVDNVTIDTTAHTVTMSVNHFTDFALVSPENEISSTPTPTPTPAPSSSTSTSSSSTNQKPKDIDAYLGRTISRDDWVFIVPASTFNWDAYLTLTSTPKNHPTYVSGLWQVSPLWEIWFKASFNDAKIVKPNHNILMAVKYQKGWLEDKLPEDSLKMAFSSDKKHWQVLDSVLDKSNRTVAVLDKAGGYYILVAGWQSPSVYTGQSWVPETNTSNPPSSIEAAPSLTPTPTQSVNQPTHSSPSSLETTPIHPSPPMPPRLPWYKRLLRWLFH